MVLKTGVSVCLRPNPLPETTRAVTLHGEGSFGFPAVTETTGRRLPSEASPSGGAGDKNKEKVQSGSRWTWCKKLPEAGSLAEGRARKTGSYPEEFLLSWPGQAGQRRSHDPLGYPRAQRPPEPLHSEAFWTPFPWPRAPDGHTWGHSCVLSHESALRQTVWCTRNCDGEADIWRSVSRERYGERSRCTCGCLHWRGCRGELVGEQDTWEVAVREVARGHGQDTISMESSLLSRWGVGSSGRDSKLQSCL